MTACCKITDSALADLIQAALWTEDGDVPVIAARATGHSRAARAQQQSLCFTKRTSLLAINQRDSAVCRTKQAQSFQSKVPVHTSDSPDIQRIS